MSDTGARFVGSALGAAIAETVGDRAVLNSLFVQGCHEKTLVTRHQ